MALKFPYPLAFLSDCLTGGETRVYPTRNDEIYGRGSAEVWAAELASPTWAASVTLYDRPPAEARKINARVWALGSNKEFYFADPFYAGPVAGVSGLGGVTITTIAADKASITLGGFPAGFSIATGEAFSFLYGTGNVYYGVFLEDKIATSSGVIAGMQVFPYIPIPAVTGVAVELVKPFFKAIVPPDGFTEFSNVRGAWGTGAAINVVQRV